MGTTTITSTVNTGETAAIQSVSGVSAPDFDAVMALIGPVAPATSDPSASPAALPIGTANPSGFDGISPSNDAAKANPNPLPAAIPPVLSNKVNAASDGADEFAFLLAANRVAGAGVSARPPQPETAAETIDLTTDLDASALHLRPRLGVAADFIGPVRPAALAQPGEIAAIAPEDFVGPLLPPDRIAIASTIPSTPDNAEILLHSEALETATLPVLDEAELREAEAQLQPWDEHLREHAAAPMIALSQSLADMPDAGSALALPGAEGLAVAAPSVLQVATPFAPNPAEIRAVAAGAGPATGSMSRESIAMVSMVALSDSPELSPDETASLATKAKDAERDGASQGAQISDDSARSQTITFLAGMTLPQPVQQTQANAKPAAATNATTSNPSSAPAPVRIRDDLPTRDAALLQTMAALVTPQKKSDDPRAQSVRNRADAPVAAPMEFDTLVSSDLSRGLIRSDGRLPNLSGLIMRDRDATRNDDKPRPSTIQADKANETSAPILDAKLTSMIREISITGAAAHDKTLASPLSHQTPAPLIQPSASDATTREAAQIASVTADGRRDTQRDADLRQRQVQQQINLALRQGIQEVRMQLYPPGLGQVMIRIALDGQKLRLSMKADNAEANDALLQAEEGLRDAFARDGYVLAGFDLHEENQNNRKNRSSASPETPATHKSDDGDAFALDMTV